MKTSGVYVDNMALDVTAQTATQFNHYTADVQTATDYYAFSSPMNGRNFIGANSYRYGFNDKESDDEIDGHGSTIDYGMRTYDSRIGRFFSEDPLTKKYPELTPYQFASNTPIWANDLDGAEANYLWQASGLNPEAKGQDAINQTRAVMEPALKKVGKFFAEAWLMLVTMGESEAGVVVGSETRIATKVAEEEIVVGTEVRVLSEGESKAIPEATETHKAVSKEVGSTSESTGPKEPYNREKHYGKTPTAKDRKDLGAKEGEVVDHKTPLVKHYYEGQGPGTKKGYQMTEAERKAFANDRNNMQIHSDKESHSQGGKLSKYSKDKKKEFNLNKDNKSNKK